MKRSKFFLGTTTAVLAIAGVAAAKHYGVSTTRYYITKNGNYCKAQASTCTKIAGTQQCFFTAQNPIAFQYPLLTKGPEGPKTGSNCLTPLLYQTEH